MRSLGAIQTAAYVAQKLRARRASAQPYRLRSKHARHPLWCRPGTTDELVFDQIFIEREYSCLDGLPGAGLIIDCGANVGYSSAYLLTRFPGSTVIAVEPDPVTFATLEANLAPYGSRASAILSGVWSHETGLVIEEAPYRGGGAWATQVRECRPGEAAQMRAVDVGSLIRGSGFDRVSLLKVDIEGAEAIVFGAGCEEWLPLVDAIVIELHDDSAFGDAPRVFMDAISGRGFAIGTSGELTVCLGQSTSKRQVGP